MNVRRRVALLLVVPAVFAAAAAISFHVRNRNNGWIVSSGERCEYLLHVPPGYDGSAAVPLVISLHGAGGWPAQQMRLTRWNELADRERFIVVYPSAADGPGPRIWHVGEHPAMQKDVRFIADLISHLKSTYRIDSRRIYLSGFSNGGGMAFALSCMMPDRIAAIGTVSAARTLSSNRCSNRRPLPMIDFHGTDDPHVPYAGGMSWLAPMPFPDVQRFDARWAQQNGCGPFPVESRASLSVHRREYTHCIAGASVILYTIDGGGHAWPGGGRLPEYFVGRSTNDISATEEMWAFFRAHPLPRQDPRKSFTSM